MKTISFPLLLDGATGTMLQNAGMPAGVSTEAWVLENPDALRALHDAYRRAGSDAVLAPTFSANRLSLAQHGVDLPVEEVNRRLLDLTRQGVGPDVLIGGDMTSTGSMIEPLGELSFEELIQIYRQQAEALVAAGADFLMLETLTSLTDARAGLLAWRSVTDRPVFVSLTCGENGRTFTGTDAAAALVTLQAMGASAVGLNCSAGPDMLSGIIARMAPYARIPLLAKPNAGMPQTLEGRAVYSCGPEEFASYVPELARRGVQIFGGCCGTTPDHIAALRQALDDLPSDGPLPAEEGVFCATDRQIFPLNPDMDKSDPIRPGEDFEEDAMEADPDELFRVVIDSEEALDCFIQGSSYLRAPLCVIPEGPELLEKTLRAWQGLACCEQDRVTPGEDLNRLCGTYGLTVLS